MRKIRLDQIGDYSEEQINTLLSAVVLTADRIVKEGSPVDTGRLAVSWQIGQNAENGAPAAEGKYGQKGLGLASQPKTLNYRFQKSSLIYSSLMYTFLKCFL